MELRRYADVAAALKDPRLSPNPCGTEASQRAHLQVREAARGAFGAKAVEALRIEIATDAHALLARLPLDRPVDLVREFAKPWCLALAAKATGVTADATLASHATEVFAGAASPDEAGLQERGTAAAAELARVLQGPGASAGVQAFVALTQTLPCLLGNAWHALLEHPGEAARLWSGACAIEQAIEELLRYAGPSRVVFRYTESGQRLALHIAEANRDAEQFPDPDRLDLARDASGHLALGAGPHFCAGADLIRMAVSVAMEALVTRGNIEAAGPAEWRGGFAIRGVASLPVLFRGEQSGRNVLIEKS